MTSACAPPVLVTGASGLLGRHVVAAFAGAGAAVTGVDVVAPAGAAGPRMRVCDLARDDLSALFDPSPDVVVHAAAIPDLGRGHAEADVLATNVAATSRLMFAALEAGVRRLVYVSSQSVLGLSRGPGLRPPAYLPIDEDHPAGPRDGYALSKKLGEDLAALLAERFGAAVTSLRFPVIWDPARRAEHVARRLGDPEQAARSNWAYVDVRDAAQAIVLAAARGDPGHRLYNVAAARSFCREPLPGLVAVAYGDLPARIDLGAGPTLFSPARAIAELGYRPRYHWTEHEVFDDEHQ